MKTVFIDIDGPLAWGTWDGGKVKIMGGTSNEFTIPYPWVKEDCEALAKILEHTGADLVVSSDWRKYYGIYQLRMIFEHYGINHWRILDTTTHVNLMHKLSSPPEWDRACEIKTWVKSFRPTHWVSIDDINLKHPFQLLRIPQWRHIQVNGDFGTGGRLRDKIDECVEKLNK